MKQLPIPYRIRPGRTRGLAGKQTVQNIHKMSKVEDRTSSFKENSGENKDTVAETTGEEMARGAASKRKGGGANTRIFKGHESGR